MAAAGLFMSSAGSTTEGKVAFVEPKVWHSAADKSQILNQIAKKYMQDKDQSHYFYPDGAETMDRMKEFIENFTTRLFRYKSFLHFVMAMGIDEMRIVEGEDILNGFLQKLGEQREKLCSFPKVSTKSWSYNRGMMKQPCYTKYLVQDACTATELFN